MRALTQAGFLSLAVLFALSGCDSSSSEDNVEDFSLDALEVSVSNEMSDSQSASVEANATTIDYTIEITNANEAEATDVTAVINLYANDQNPDGSCEYCGNQIGFASGGAETVAAGETITERGSLGLGGDFDGELCYDYELEAAPEGGELESESYGGSCEDVDWETIPQF